MTNSITEIPKVRVQLSEWQVILHLYIYIFDSVQMWGNVACIYLNSHPMLGEH